jgi:hypothetical protein
MDGGSKMKFLVINGVNLNLTGLREQNVYGVASLAQINEKIKKFADASLKKDVMKSPFITVNSWNEWTETSYLEPDDLYGYGYLEAIKDVFGEK